VVLFCGWNWAVEIEVGGLADSSSTLADIFGGWLIPSPLWLIFQEFG